MTETFFNFIIDTTDQNFTSSQNEVFNHPNYNPYSKDLDAIEDFLDQDKLIDATNYSNINTILSPRVHLYKNYALAKLNKTKEAESELILAQKIMEGISLTGDGSKLKPYKVTRISDEKDMLRYFDEAFASQSLINGDDKIMDLITCESGRAIYFDITTPYSRMKVLMDNQKIESPIKNMKDEDFISKKKWWEFWK